MQALIYSAALFQTLLRNSPPGVSVHARSLEIPYRWLDMLEE